LCCQDPKISLTDEKFDPTKLEPGSTTSPLIPFSSNFACGLVLLISALPNQQKLLALESNAAQWRFIEETTNLRVQLLDLVSLALYRDLKSDLLHKDPEFYHCSSLAWLAENTTDEISTFNIAVCIHYAISRIESQNSGIFGNKMVGAWKDRVKAALYHKTADLAKQKTQVQTVAREMIDNHKKFKKIFTIYKLLAPLHTEWPLEKEDRKKQKTKKNKNLTTN